MKHLRRYLPLLALLLMLAGSLTSCRDAGVRDALQRAEALMETDPHAARAVLDSLMPNVDCQTSDSQTAAECLGKGSRAKVLSDSLQSVSLKSFSRKDVADWAWLKVQADYKCDIPLTTDSIARIATNYYGTPRRPDYHAAMAWYTLGCVYKEMSDDVNGTDAFLKAKSLFPDTLIRYYALTETNLGIHHLNRHMNCEAAHEFQSSKQNLIRLGDSTAVAFLDLSLARCCLHKENYASAREWLERVLRNPHASQYISTVAHFEMAKVETYYIHDYAKALEYIDYDIRHTPNKKGLTGTYSLKAATLQEQGSLDSAWHYYHCSLNSQSSPATFSYVYRQMAILAPQLGKADSIADYVRFYHTYIDSLYIISNQQAIRQVENDHRVEMEQRRLEEEHRLLVLTVSLTALVLVILVLAVLVWSLNLANRKKQQYIQISDQLKLAQMQEERQKAELAKVKAEAEKLKNVYHDALQHINEQETLSSTDYENRIRICVNQFRKGLSWQLVQKYLHGSEHFLRKEERAAIRHDINVCFTDFYEILRAEGEKVNQTEKMVSACYILGFKTEETEEILGFSDSTVRVQKHRLKEKLPQDLYNTIFSFSFKK